MKFLYIYIVSLLLLSCQGEDMAEFASRYPEASQSYSLSSSVNSLCQIDKYLNDYQKISEKYINSESHGSCTQDDECLILENKNCLDTCASQVITFSNSGLTDFFESEELSQLCTNYESSECYEPSFQACQQDEVTNAVCFYGKCMAATESENPALDSELIKSNRTKELYSRRVKSVGENKLINYQCDSADQCEVVNSPLFCQWNITPPAVNIESVDLIKTELTSILDGYQKTFSLKECSEAKTQAICQNNFCQMKYLSY